MCLRAKRNGQIDSARVLKWMRPNAAFYILYRSWTVIRRVFTIFARHLSLLASLAFRRINSCHQKTNVPIFGPIRASCILVLSFHAFLPITLPANAAGAKALWCFFVAQHGCRWPSRRRPDQKQDSQHIRPLHFEVDYENWQWCATQLNSFRALSYRNLRVLPITIIRRNILFEFEVFFC